MAKHLFIGTVIAIGATIGSAANAPTRQAAPPAGGAGTALATVKLTRGVMADGKALAAGTYQVRLSPEEPAPAVGQSPHAEHWVEFVSNGNVQGREVASVVTADRMRTMAKGPQPAPKPNTYRIETLRGGDYIRVWINSGGTHYLINLRNPAKAP